MRSEGLRLLVVIVLTAGSVACGGPTEGSPELSGTPSNEVADPSATVVDATYGELEPRVAALEAFDGGRGAVTIRMDQSSVEGVGIVFQLAVREGSAELSIDERADGGGIRAYTLDALQLVRYVPARWEANVEVEKDHFEVVDVANARAQPGTYLLVHPRCLTTPCAEVF